MYVCTQCQTKGSIVKRLHQYEVDSARAQEQRLASTQCTDELSECIRELREEKQGLLVKQAALEKEVQSLAKQLVKARTTVIAKGKTTPVESKDNEGTRNEVHVSPTQEVVNESSHSEDESSGKSSSSSHSSSSVEDDKRKTAPRKGQIKDPHPPGFRYLISHVEKFSGNQGDDDFELWLMDFNETTRNCGWTDEQCSRWFSWFLSGPAKATWQRTLTEKDKNSWSKIVKIYRGQYGIHMDPRIAYQRCQELQYGQFGSAQGLLNAMRDYQRMAPEKLTDATMESILWNKVPLELQQELGGSQVGRYRSYS